MDHGSGGGGMDASTPGRRMAARVFSSLPPALRRRLLHVSGRFAPWEEGFDPTPPVPAPDEVIGPPDFVGIGVQKAGTTWWYDLIAAHPEVSSRPDIHKERHILTRYGARPFDASHVDLYHGWFPRRPNRITGEWTPDYFHLPWVPDLLVQAAPDTKLLVLLRDPVERFRSGLEHVRRDRGELTYEQEADAAARGFYARALTQWLDRFSSEQLLVLQFERCAADPEFELQRTYAFLGLNPFVPPNLHRPINATASGWNLDPAVRRRVTALYADDVLALAQLVPSVDLRLWPHFSSLVRA